MGVIYRSNITLFKAILRWGLYLIICFTLALGATGLLTAEPAQSLPDCHFVFPTINSPHEYENIWVQEDVGFSLQFQIGYDVCPDCTASCTNPSFTLRTPFGCPSWVHVDGPGLIASGIPPTGSAGSYTVMFDVATTSSGQPCCWNYARRNVVFQVVKVGGGGGGSTSGGSNYIPVPLPTPTTYKFTIKIGPGLTEGKAGVFIDGKKQVDLAGGESRDFETDIGTSPVVSVSSTIDGQQGNRFVVKGDAEKKVSEGDTSAYFDYAPAVNILFVTDPPDITTLNGSGWYSVGDRVQSSAPAYVDGSSPGTRYTFLNWTFANGQKSQMKSLSLTVSEPATITASYVTYYGLTVSSPYGPDETTWQKAGENAGWQVKNPQVSMDGLMGFLGGQMTAVNGSGSIMMDGPQKISVQYQPSYPWLAFIIIALVVIGGGLFAYFRLKSARAGAAAASSTDAGTSATIAEATTEVKTETVAPAAKKKKKTSAVPKTESTPAARETEEKPREAPKFCTECGRPAGKGEKFCSGCGKKLK